MSEFVPEEMMGGIQQEEEILEVDDNVEQLDEFGDPVKKPKEEEVEKPEEKKGIELEPEEDAAKAEEEKEEIVDKFDAFIDYVKDDLDEETEELTQEELFDKVVAKARGEAKEEYNTDFEEIINKLDSKLEGRLKHVINGGDLDDFDPAAYNSPYSKLEEADIDGKNAEKIVRYNLELSGMDGDDIDDLITTWKDLEKLEGQAKKALPKVKQHEAKRKEEVDKRLQYKTEEKQKAAKASEEQAKAFQEAVNNNIKGLKEFGGIKVTKK